MAKQLKDILNNEKACYAIFNAHDSRFDGKIFIGISSTGIYCRPICRVKKPKAKNCSYYSSAAAAEAAGFRPCLKCRPELAPGLSPADSSKQAAGKAALIIEEECLYETSLPELAQKLGITDRHLRRIFLAEFGVPPVQYLQTRRLLLAKSLLTDTKLSVTDAALTAGFGSIRRFNDLFRKYYKLTPSALKKQNKDDKTDSQSMTLRLGYRPPYGWEKLLSFLEARAIPGVESVENNSYRRTVSLRKKDKNICGWISVQNNEKKNFLLITVSLSLLSVLPKVLSRLRQLFDLNCEPSEIFSTLSVMNRISPGLCEEGTRLPGCFDPYEMSIRAILGQQITVKAARTLAGRITESFGTKIVTPFKDLTHTFPLPQTICSLAAPVEDQLCPLGMTGARARSIFALSKAVTDGTVTLSGFSDPETEMKKLLALPGFGPWTVHYIAMRALGYTDAFLHTDYGVKKAFPGKTEKEILKLSESWQPWRSYAVINLWNSL